MCYQNTSDKSKRKTGTTGKLSGRRTREGSEAHQRAPVAEASIYSTTVHGLLTWQHCVYLVNDEGVETGGLKVHVDEDNVGRLKGGIVVSTAELTVGDVLLPLALNISVSLMVTSDKGERTTDPGVMLGSSSTLLICVP